jgi:hypothetical protein
MSETVQASNGVQLPLSDLNTIITYSAGFPATITVVYDGITYISTFTNNGANVTAISPYIAQ